MPEDVSQALSWLGRNGLPVGIGLFVLVRWYLRARQVEDAAHTSPGREAISLGVSGRPTPRARGEDPLAEARALRQEIEAHPLDIRPRLKLGRRLSESGREREAVPLLQEATVLAPTNADARLELGRALAAIGRWQDALASLDEAVRLRPALAEAHEARGDALAQLQRSGGAGGEAGVAPLAATAWTEAARLYETQLESDPANAALRGQLGCVLIRSGQVVAGLSHLRQAALESPHDADVQGRLADVLSDLERFEEAKAQYHVAAAAQRRLTQPNPRHAGHHARLGELLNEAEEEGDDEAWLDALLLDPDYPNVAEVVAELGEEGGELLVTAAQHLSAGRWSEAAAGFRAVLEEWPPVAAHALCGLGEALLHLGARAPARQALERALALRPGWWRPQEHLARLGGAP